MSKHFGLISCTQGLWLASYGRDGYPGVDLYLPSVESLDGNIYVVNNLSMHLRVQV